MAATSSGDFMADVADGSAAASDDEVLELPLAPIGSYVSVVSDEDGSTLVGNVLALSPGGTRMHVALQQNGQELWLGADDTWELSEIAPAAVSSRHDGPPAVDQADEQNAEESKGGEEEDTHDPILEMWRWTPDGALCGYVYGKRGFRAGELMTTSVVPPEGRFATHVVRWVLPCACPTAGCHSHMPPYTRRRWPSLVPTCMHARR